MVLELAAKKNNMDKDENKDHKDKDLKKETTPIMDGDSRPDQVIEPDFSDEKDDKMKGKKKEVTVNRAADVNNLEDYKDSK